MAYISVAQRKQAITTPSVGGYIPVAERQKEQILPEIAFDTGFPSLTTKTSTPAVLSPDFQTPQKLLGGLAKTIGQYTAQNILSATMSFSKPSAKGIAEPIQASDLEGSPFVQSLFENLFGKEAVLKPVETRIAEAEPKIKEWQAGLQEVLKTPNLNTREKLVLKTLSGLKPINIAFLGIMGDVGLDLTPFGGLEKNVFKQITKVRTIGEGLILGSKLGIADDLLENFAQQAVRVGNDIEAEKLFKSIANLQQTTVKAPIAKPAYIPVAERTAPQRAITVNDFQERVIAGQDLGKEIGKRVNPDGTITLYHGTSKANAENILKKGFNEGTYFSVSKTGTKFGDSPLDVARRKYGKDAIIMEIKVDAQGLESAAAGSEVFSPQKLLKDNQGIYGTKTKSQLTDIWKEAKVKELREGLPELPKIKRTPAKEPTLEQLSILSKKVDDLIASGKSKDALKSEIDDLREQLSFIEEGFDELPGGKLTKFMSRKEGEFLDFRNPDLAKTPKEAEMIRERNAKVMRASESAFQGTSKSDMFDDPDTIREAIEQFQKAKASINNIKEQINSLGKERAVFSKAEKAVSIGIEHRRSQYRSIQDRWTLTDNEIKQFLHGRNISAMDADEWRTFIKEADDLGEATAKQRDAMAQLKSTIEEKDLKKFENLQASLDLPPIHKMNTEQLINFEKILAEYKAGDEFLPVRMLQTLPNTELAGVKTTREVLEVLSKKSGRAVEDMPIKMTEFHRMSGDRRLARQHPFFEVLVERKNRSLLEAEARTIEITDEMDGLIKDARKSKKRGILERLIPKDENITLWSETLEGAERTAIEKTMTKEELVAAKRWDEVRRAYYDYLVKKHAEQKFSRFEGQYFPHVRRGFLEAWKEDGVIKAFKEMKDKYRQDQFTMDILNEQTGDILPYEKWIGFAQFRSDKLIPTQNASKAIEAYVTALEKAKHLDEMTPEIMAYVHSLSPRNFSEFGVELDTSLKKFVKEYLNANKGRVPKGFFNPGGSFDVGNRSLIALTRVLDLGWNFTTQIVAPVGENLMTLTMLKPQAYALAQARARTSQAKAISTKYKNFVGKTPWEEMTRSANDIGDKFMAGAFAIYGQSSRQANRLFLLGKMTDEEFKTGIISVERLTTLQLEMSKYRQVKGLESIRGRTTEVEAVKQYKSWAIPPLTATIENSYTLAGMIRKDGVAKALSSDAGKELFYSIGIGSAIGLYTYTKYRELKDKGGKRTFVEDIAFKAMRDGVSILGVFDPTMWSGVRVADFLEDLARASADLIMLETYKTTGELKAPKEFERLLTPAILKRVMPDEEKSPAKTGLPSLPKLPKLPQLPKLPKIGK